MRRHYAECCVLFIIILNAIVLSVVMLSVMAPTQSTELNVKLDWLTDLSGIPRLEKCVVLIDQLDMSNHFFIPLTCLLLSQTFSFSILRSHSFSCFLKCSQSFLNFSILSLSFSFFLVFFNFQFPSLLFFF